MRYIRNCWPWILCFLFWVAFVWIILSLGGCDRKIRQENERLREELARAQQYVPLHRDTIRDTVEVITQKIVEVEKVREVLSDDDLQLLKDLHLKAKEIESYQKVGTVTHDTVYLERKDTTNTLYYKDAWAEFEYRDKRLAYSMKDSLAIAVKKEYRHRLLWWRWGIKGYEVKAVNFNPHSTIRYNTYVKSKP